MLAHLLLFAFSALLLWFGAVWVVDSAAAIARKFNISELIIGLTVVAMGTSAPEFMVTASAAFKGLPDISLSNIVGSNIFNLGIILGLLAMMRPLKTNKAILWRDGALLWCLVALILVMALNHTLGRAEGIFLLLILVGYMVFLLLKRQKEHDAIQPLKNSSPQRTARFWDWPKLLAGFIGVAAGGSLMVDAASSLAAALGVSQWLIGVTIVAAGTSLPEFVTCLGAGVTGRDQ
ncbi:MAG: sodium:calcium antiporter, partial [Thermodesulfobacteriota bacterium]|nr:sodium:calcium antiporter [Thermodesulfobacteriota bacterium]